jgi:hypothetical protein
MIFMNPIKEDINCKVTIFYGLTQRIEKWVSSRSCWRKMVSNISNKASHLQWAYQRYLHGEYQCRHGQFNYTSTKRNKLPIVNLATLLRVH